MLNPLALGLKDRPLSIQSHKTEKTTPVLLNASARYSVTVSRETNWCPRDWNRKIVKYKESGYQISVKWELTGRIYLLI